MVGIKSYGAYVPRYRLSRKTISKAMGWFNPAALPGEKAVANYDEDSLTMAVAAGMGCLKGFDSKKVDGVFFASTTPPYAERQSSSIINDALDLRRDVRSADFTDSVKAGAAALLSACEAVMSGQSGDILVCAADTRLGKVSSTQEQMFGDGACSFLVGNEGVIAALEGHYSLSVDFMDYRRLEKDKYVRGWEERWIRDEGYSKIIPEAITGYLSKYKLSTADIDKVVYACPYSREHAVIGKKLGFTPENIQDNLITQVGDTGAAYALMMLAAALEEAQPGQRILVVGYGNGCDVLCFKVTEEINKFKSGLGFKKSLENRKELESYEKYTVFRDLIPYDTGIRGEDIVYTPMTLLFKERKMVHAFYGSKCTACGTPQYPSQRVCVNPKCGAVDQMEDYRFASKDAVIFTYTADNLAPSINPPAIYGIIDFVAGGRYYFDFTDCDLDCIKVGMKVEMSFRRKYTDERRSIYGYGWKAVPVGEGC